MSGAILAESHVGYKAEGRAAGGYPRGPKDTNWEGSLSPRISHPRRAKTVAEGERENQICTCYFAERRGCVVFWPRREGGPRPDGHLLLMSTFCSRRAILADPLSTSHRRSGRDAEYVRGG